MCSNHCRIPRKKRYRVYHVSDVPGGRIPRRVLDTEMARADCGELARMGALPERRVANPRRFLAELKVELVLGATDHSSGNYGWRHGTFLRGRCLRKATRGVCGSGQGKFRAIRI